MGAAIPLKDPEVAGVGKGSRLPVLAICNPQDVTLRYVYAAFGRLLPTDDAAAHVAFLELTKEKGYSSISMFQFFPLFCYLRETCEEVVLHDLLVSQDAWMRILREGGTRTFEGWGKETKWNTSLFHLTTASVAWFLCE